MSNNKDNIFHIDGNRHIASEIADGLYLVPTPIGHLKDITLRALDVLAGADLILCEDTRHSRKLLDRYGITTPLKAYHDHSAEAVREAIIAKVEQGQAVALISDAGMPVISDPGFKLLENIQEKQLPYTVLPGPSAGLTALIASGLPPHPHLFYGFLSSKKQKRQEQLEALASYAVSLIFYEAPHRLVESLQAMQDVFGDRSASVGRELTKQFEENRLGFLSELRSYYEQNAPKGEIVICVAPPEVKQWSEEEIDLSLKLHISKMPVKKAAQEVAQLSGLSKRDLYQRALVLKNDG